MKSIQPQDILSILDQCCEDFTFPMLDNGYVYLAATRLSLFRSPEDWALVIEVFGFSPRAGLPDTYIQTFASRLHARNTPENYVTREAYERYLSNNPHNESEAVFPIAEGPWQEAEYSEYVAAEAGEVVVREQAIPLPALADYARHGIELEDPLRVHVFELCRFLAAIARDRVLATSAERRVNVLPEMKQILLLEEWHHPNVVEDEERPSGSQTFQQLAEVLASGKVEAYAPVAPPNTHWRHWPDGGTL